MITSIAASQNYGYSKDGKPLCVHLTEQEERLIGLLRSFVSDNNLSCTLRIAGGWVRDKLLGLPSEDLDIAIDNMMGTDFAHNLQVYMREKGIEDHTIAVIQTNPDKSKHLETATTKIFNMHIDFVNLRAESYHQSSRIPSKVTFGSVEDDAFRRDISINALFFNLHTLSVEDFTKRGLNDLHNGLIQTPLNPTTTFLDDPLRVLRVVRFASRFNYCIAENIFTAVKSSQIRQALARKISKERLGVEVEKILKGKNPFQGLKWFIQLEICDVIFCDPTQTSSSTILSSNNDCNKACYDNCYDFTIPNREQLIAFEDYLNKMTNVPSLLPKNIPISYLACSLLYFAGRIVTVKNKTEQIASVIVRESLKLSNTYANEIERIFSMISQFNSYINRTSPEWTRKETGLLLRNAKDNWDVVVLMAYLMHSSPDSSLYELFHKHVFQTRLVDCWNMKNVLSGIEICQLLNKEKGGPFLTGYIQALTEFQLENEYCDKKEAEQFIIQLASGENKNE